MNVDRFEIRVDVPRPGGGFKHVEFRINGAEFIELVREAELPHALREYDERVAGGESSDDLGARGSRAGEYLYLNGGDIFLPSQNLLGEPYRHGFRVASDDPINRKSLLLSCTCGITDCWFLLANINVTPDHVIWSDFCQFHRDWQYDLGPFVFDRREYESQLSR